MKRSQQTKIFMASAFDNVAIDAGKTAGNRIWEELNTFSGSD